MENNAINSSPPGFLYNLFADPDIIRLPSFLGKLQKPIAYLISKRRAPKSQEAYQSIGGGSPIVRYTNEQANLIARAVKERHGVDIKTYIGMRYWYPFTEQGRRGWSEATATTAYALPT